MKRRGGVNARAWFYTQPGFYSELGFRPALQAPAKTHAAASQGEQAQSQMSPSGEDEYEEARRRAFYRQVA